MQTLNTMKIAGNITCKVYAKFFETMFDVLFGSFKSASMIDMYCNEHYYMTSGGVIMIGE